MANKITYGTAAISGTLFSYFITNPKRFKYAITLLVIGGGLKGVTSKGSTIHNIGTTTLAGCLFSIPGLCLGYPLFKTGERSFGEFLIAVFIGLNASAQAYWWVKNRAAKPNNASWTILALRSTQYYLDKALEQTLK